MVSNDDLWVASAVGCCPELLERSDIVFFSFSLKEGKCDKKVLLEAVTPTMLNSGMSKQFDLYVQSMIRTSGYVSSSLRDFL